MARSSLPMKRLAQGKPSFSYGGAMKLVDVFVHEIESAVLKGEVEDCKNYMIRWRVCE